MKKLTFYTKAKDSQDSKATGFAGVLLRFFLFLLSLGLLVLLLSFLHRCSSDGRRSNIEPPHRIETPVDSVVHVPDRQPHIDDPLPPHDIERPSPNLPNPDDNFLPPIDDDRIDRDSLGRRTASDRLNVILDSDPNDETFNRWADAFKQAYPDDGYKIVYYDRMTKLIQIQVPPGKVDEVMRDINAKIPDISFRVFPEGFFDGAEAVHPNDPAFRNPNDSWYFAPIQAYDAWGITQGSPDITVAIVDSYFDLQHPELYSDRIVNPYSVAKRSRDVAPEAGMPGDLDVYYHGSCVASMALANINNGNGACGIAPKCKFMPVSLGARFSTMTVMSGLLYAIYQGANVVNLSIGSTFPEGTDQMPIEDQISVSRGMFGNEEGVWDYIFSLAEARNVTIVWAAGNCNVLATMDASKRADNTIRVSALDRNLHKADFSNYGNLEQYNIKSSDISAPGVDIYGATPRGGYQTGNGTSYSAPIVTGAVALMRSLDPTLTTNEIKQILQETGKPIVGCTTIGPQLQIYDALRRVKGQMARADEMINDHSKIVGLWKTTAQFPIIDAETGEDRGYSANVYFRFKDESHGEIIACTPDNGISFRHLTDINWQGNSFQVDVDSNSRYGCKRYIFTKADDGLLQFRKDGVDETYNMRRTDRVPCE